MGLIAHLERRFFEVGVVAAFGILCPQAATLPEDTAHTKLRILVEKFCSCVDFVTALEEEQVGSGPLKVTYKCDIFTWHYRTLHCVTDIIFNLALSLK